VQKTIRSYIADDLGAFSRLSCSPEAYLQKVANQKDRGITSVVEKTVQCGYTEFLQKMNSRNEEFCGGEGSLMDSAPQAILIKMRVSVALYRGLLFMGSINNTTLRRQIRKCNVTTRPFPSGILDIADCQVQAPAMEIELGILANNSSPTLKPSCRLSTSLHRP
jgi:hypothetical protein